MFNLNIGCEARLKIGYSPRPPPPRKKVSQKLLSISLHSITVCFEKCVVILCNFLYFLSRYTIVLMSFRCALCFSKNLSEDWICVHASQFRIL